MGNIRTINAMFTKEEMMPMYELKEKKKWTWVEMIKETTDFYIKNNKEENN